MFLKFSTKVIAKENDYTVKMYIHKERIISVSSLLLDGGNEVAEIVYLDADGIGRHVVTEETFEEIANKL